MLGTKQFLEYLIPKIGLERALKLNERTVYSYTRRENLEPKILPAVVQLTKEYDIGVAIASKGLILGYYFDLRGFPIKVVNQKRKGKGATWNPIDNLEDLTDKNVLLLESDIITGRSAKRAERELQKFKPKLIDLLLLFETVPISVGDYERTQKFLPQPEKILQSRFTPNVKILSAEFIKKGLKVKYVRVTDESVGENEILFSKEEYIGVINTRTNAPKEIRKIMTIEKDF